MRFAQCVFMLLIAPILSADSIDAAGRWKAKVTGGVIHMTIADATFDFKVEGNQLTGKALIGQVGYPGAAPISEGTINGNRVSFTVIGEHASSNGIPLMRFVGTIRGKELDLTMNFKDGYGTTITQMKAEKVSK